LPFVFIFYKYTTPLQNYQIFFGKGLGMGRVNGEATKKGILLQKSNIYIYNEIL